MDATKAIIFIAFSPRLEQFLKGSGTARNVIRPFVPSAKSIETIQEFFSAKIAIELIIFTALLLHCPEFLRGIGTALIASKYKRNNRTRLRSLLLRLLLRHCLQLQLQLHLQQQQPSSLPQLRRRLIPHRQSRRSLPEFLEPVHIIDKSSKNAPLIALDDLQILKVNAKEHRLLLFLT
jgi:hypothetical protein